MSLEDVIAGRQPWHVETADVLAGLAQIPDGCVQTVVTSPPYWGLRNYGVDGQIGLEETPELFIDHLAAIFHEVKRVLRDDGTLWLNMGDSYSGSGKGQMRDGTHHANPSDKQATNRGTTTAADLPVYGRSSGLRRDGRPEALRAQQAHESVLTQGLALPYDRPEASIPAKNLIGQPWRLAFALQADGWILRSDIIWHKPAPMPESVLDRPTRSHEYIFLFTKSPRYFYDADAIREPAEQRAYPSWDERKQAGEPIRRGDPGGSGYVNHGEGMGVNAAGRNSRSVWTIGPEPFSEAHFATFPPALPDRCIRAGTSEAGCCAKCGAPWRRVVEREAVPEHIRAQFEAARERTADEHGRTDGFTTRKPNYQREVLSTRWEPSCGCHAGVVPCLVLDPFSGSGTTVMVARRLGRRGIGLELNPEYAAMARRRIAEDLPMFNRPAEQGEQPALPLKLSAS